MIRKIGLAITIYLLIVVFLQKGVLAQGDFQKQYPYNGDNAILSVAEVDDGGYLILGWKKDKGEGTHRVGYILKLDAKGDSVSSIDFNYQTTDFFAEKLIKLGSGKYVFAAERGYDGDIVVYGIDAGGGKLWEKELPPRNRQDLEAISRVNDREVIMVTDYSDSREPFGNMIHMCSADGSLWKGPDISLVKFSRIYEGCLVKDVCATADRNFIVAGSALDKERKDYPAIAKLDRDGDTVWSKVLYFPNYDEGECISVMENAKGEYIILSKFKRGKISDIALARYSSEGKRLSRKSFYLPSDDEPIMIRPFKPGYFFVVFEQKAGGQARNNYIIIDETYTPIAETNMGQQGVKIITTDAHFTASGAMLLTGYSYQSGKYQNTGFFFKSGGLNAAFEKKLKELKK